MSKQVQPSEIITKNVFDRFSRKIHAWVWGTFFLIIIGLVLVNVAFGNRNLWDGWRESNELRHPVYWETVHIELLFRTCANTWSNMFYVLVGLYSIFIGLNDMRRRCAASNYLERTPALGILFGVACCYLGFGSGLFHASLTYRGQQLDVAAMYSPLVALIALNLGRWLPTIRMGGRREGVPTWPVLAVLAVIVSALLYVYKWQMASGVVLPVLILIVTVFGILDRFQSRTKLTVRWLLMAFVSLGLAVACRQIDIAGKFSSHDSWFQGHSFWHLFTSVTLFAMYLYYRSETEYAKQ